MNGDAETGSIGDDERGSSLCEHVESVHCTVVPFQIGAVCGKYVAQYFHFMLLEFSVNMSTDVVCRERGSHLCSVQCEN